MTRPVLFLASLALALVPLSVQSSYDVKFFTPGACQPYGQSSTYDTLAIRADGIQNKTDNSNKYFICGLGRDGEGDWTVTNGHVVSAYFVYNGRGTIQCTRTIGTDLGTYPGGAPAVADTLNAVPAGGNLWVVQFTEAVGVSYQSATMTCRLPPQAKFSFAQVVEGVGTDPPEPAERGQRPLRRGPRPDGRGSSPASTHG